MSKILCLYYSRSGNTRMVMEKIAELLNAELVEITDGKKRSGFIGFLTSGFDATKKTPEQLESFHAEQPLNTYDHVILGTENTKKEGKNGSASRPKQKRRGKKHARKAKRH